jgi:hypothetical protein
MCDLNCLYIIFEPKCKLCKSIYVYIYNRLQMLMLKKFLIIGAGAKKLERCWLVNRFA